MTRIEIRERKRAREDMVLRLREEGLTLAAIGRIFNVSRERIRQVAISGRRRRGEAK